jgi:hypothetical protein
MISYDAALRYVTQRSQDRTPREVVLGLLRGEAVLYPGEGDGYPPEDVVAQLLRHKDKTSPALYDVCVRACMEMGAEVLKHLAGPDEVKAEEPVLRMLERLCRVIALSAPPELEPTIESLAPQLSRRRGEIPGFAYDTFVAFSRYKQTRPYLEFWENLVAEEKFAALAFNKMVEIDPNYPRLAEHLKTLWVNQIEYQWRIDVPFLALGLEEALRRSGKPEPRQVVLTVLLSFKRNAPVWEKIERCLSERNRAWARDWLGEVRAPSRSLERPAIVENAPVTERQVRGMLKKDESADVGCLARYGGTFCGIMTDRQTPSLVLSKMCVSVLSFREA